MTHYFKQIGMKKNNIIHNWCKGDKRQKNWKKQRKKYGFDERETWNLDTAFYQWLYPRLRMYNEINCVDATAIIYEYKGKEVNLQWCIDRMLKRLKYILVVGELDDFEKYHNSIDEVLDLFRMCLPALWW